MKTVRITTIEEAIEHYDNLGLGALWGRLAIKEECRINGDMFEVRGSDGCLLVVLDRDGKNYDIIKHLRKTPNARHWWKRDTHCVTCGARRYEKSSRCSSCEQGYDATRNSIITLAIITAYSALMVWLAIVCRPIAITLITIIGLGVMLSSIRDDWDHLTEPKHRLFLVVFFVAVVGTLLSIWVRVLMDP